MYCSMFSSLCSIPNFTEDCFKEHILLTILLSHFPLTWYFTVTFIQTTVHTSVSARSYLAKRSSEVKIGSWIVFPYWIKTLPHCSIFTLTIIIFSLPFIFFFFPFSMMKQSKWWKEHEWLWIQKLFFLEIRNKTVASILWDTKLSNIWK